MKNLHEALDYMWGLPVKIQNLKTRVKQPYKIPLKTAKLAIDEIAILTKRIEDLEAQLKKCNCPKLTERERICEFYNKESDVCDYGKI